MIWDHRKYNFEQPTTIPGMVSIVIPTYNRLVFLLERLKEINLSSYTNYEIIVVNDGGVSVKDKLPHNVKLIELPKNSQSVSIPRNIGISYARGEYICPADDDVVFLNKKLEILTKNIGNAPLCYGGRNEIFVKENKKIASRFIKDWNPLVDSGIDNGQYIYRKSVYEKIPYVLSTHACDFYLAKEVYKNFGSFNWVEDVVSEYIWHGGNRTFLESRKHVPLDIFSFKEFFNVHNNFAIYRE